MPTLTDAIAAIEPVSQAITAQTQRLLDAKTKPRGSLGRLEALAARYAAARNVALPDAPRKAVVVMAADHGVAEEGVSAYPQEVTAHMVLNFAAGGAAINALSRKVDAELVVVDMGVKSAVDAPSVRSARIAAGTANMTRGPAMSVAQAERAIEYGIALSAELAESGVTLIGLGEMGIGNTTAASALVATLCGVAPREVTGRGTGVDDAGLVHKVEVIERALHVNRAALTDPLGILAAVGGFEIAGLGGVVLGAAARRVPVVIDGFITSSAACIAARLAPAVQGYLVASHLGRVGHGYASSARPGRCSRWTCAWGRERRRARDRPRG